jgi:hypothetical protein
MSNKNYWQWDGTRYTDINKFMRQLRMELCRKQRYTTVGCVAVKISERFHVSIQRLVDIQCCLRAILNHPLEMNHHPFQMVSS